jgi:mono/diheme cytochrome c family protein
MPATEQTWRDSKLMHMIFGISALAMLGTTVWMLAADHRREWKEYQRKFQGIESWTAESRISQQRSGEYEQQLAKAQEAWQTAQQQVPPGELVDRFQDVVAQDAEARKEHVNFDALNASYKNLKSAEPQERPPLREQFSQRLMQYVNQARFREDGLASRKKFRSADLDVARSEYELGVGNELPKSQLKTMQDRVTTVMQEVDDANVAVQNATEYRKRLESIVAEMTADEVDRKKELDDLNSQLAQLEKQLYERQNHAMKEIIGLPIVDAFSPKKLDQIWLPKLTVNYNFRDVARFDRCTNCHQAIDRTAPGSAVEPGYQPLHSVVLTMETPAAQPNGLSERSASDEAEEARYVRLLREVYGIQLAERGLLDPTDAVVSVVRPQSLAAKARIEVGDVIQAVNDATVLGKPMVYNYLLEGVSWGKPQRVTVRRGLPSPYASHPRLDLFVGSLSPHKLADVGCTICHDGQGSATAFKWASHSPNNPFEADRWQREHGWFENHHWIFPMYPKRFSESLCLKCHHEVTELEPSERFPEPPAPKLIEGFQLIQKFGCFGCHEINGFDGPNRRIGPDIRTEPNYAAAAQALAAVPGLDEQQRDWADQVTRDPSNSAARHSLSESLKNAENLPGDASVAKKLVTLLDDAETPGKLRKVGPSLRHVASKVDFNFLYSWIRKPSDFRPSTKMPQFFGLHEHLGGDSLKQSQRYEPVEIRGAVEYLLAKSQPFELDGPPDSIKSKPSAERGKMAFQVRCLACHQHSAFPEGKMSQGPDLSRIGDKLNRPDNPNGKKWLAAWLRDPSKYHPRTLMPNMLLEPSEGPDQKPTDPIADISAFLLDSKGDWLPTDVPSRELDDEESKALQALALEHLQAALNSRRQAEAYLKDGIPESLRGELKGDEVELVGDMSVAKKLRYVGRRTISKYGCAGCHDIPGFEDAKPIGTGLADWARKTPDKLAFEQILEYMKHAHGAPGPLEHAVGAGPKDVSDTSIEEADEGAYGHTHVNFLNLPADVGYFMEKLFGHQREGFIWQKLREPRSYDYQKTQNKGYNDRLRMPKFTGLDDSQREAVITFVLGLVAEPPPPQYVYRGSPKRDAITQGLAVIEKFNCAGCHTFRLDQWQLAYDPKTFDKPEAPPDYAFLEPHFTPQQRKASLEVDTRGLRHATLSGMPVADATGQPIPQNEEGTPLGPEDAGAKAYYFFMPWDNVLINGDAWQSGVQKLLVPESAIEKRFPALGGFLGRLAHPLVVAEEKKLNPNQNPDEAWGWLPPPLVGEGRKVQTEWLHSFLLDPHVIRPAAVLRMPKFNMSSDDASKLVNYFAAVDGVDYPYNFDPRTRSSYLASENAKHPERLGDALKIVTQTECIKCHLVGDYVPTGSPRNNAPRLDQVYNRMRPDFLLPWIANPKRLLPYTRMQANVPPDKPVDQALYKGSSTDQLNALVDLLLNYDRFMESKTSIKPMIKVPESTENPQAGSERQEAARAKGG